MRRQAQNYMSCCVRLGWEQIGHSSNHKTRFTYDGTYCLQIVRMFRQSLLATEK